VTGPAYFQHEFRMTQCATERGMPKAMVTYSRGVPMAEIMKDALEALAVVLESAREHHPRMRMSLDPGDWDLELLDVLAPLDLYADHPDLPRFEIQNRLIWNLGLRKGSIGTEPLVEDVA
jgi:hypothetical protein